LYFFSSLFLKEYLWQPFTTVPLSNFAPLFNTTQMVSAAQTQIQTTFLFQQMNLLIELIAFRLKHLSFTHRTNFLSSLNNLFTQSIQQQAQAQQTQQQQQQQINFIKHPQIYTNAHCAMLKLISSFSGSDYYELLNSIYSAGNKHTPRYFINNDSEEINKAIVLVIARAIHMTASDLNPSFENKEKDDSLRTLLSEIMKITPIYFPDYMIAYFPKVIQQFFINEQNKMNPNILVDSSNRSYKIALKKRVEDDYKQFLDCRHEAQVQKIFQINQINTLLCLFFNLLQDETASSAQPNFNTYLGFILSNLNGMENKRMTQSLRTLCDYLIIQSANQSTNTLEMFTLQLLKMINVYNIFSYDRFLLIMTFRSFDAADFQIALHLLYLLFVHDRTFQTKYNDFVNSWETHCLNGEWNPMFYAQYMSMHPEKFFYEGLKEQLNIAPNDNQINVYYGNMLLRCVPILDFLNNRYIELNYQTEEANSLMDTLNQLYRFHNNPISYVYNSMVYYNSKFDSLNVNDIGEKNKKRRLLRIVINNERFNTPQFSELFQNYALALKQDQNTDDISIHLTPRYYYYIIQRIVKRMADGDIVAEFESAKSEFTNPACHLLYLTVIELTSLELFTNNSSTLISTVSKSIIDLFFNG
jgi:mediator of RNA polymerase II transcription subunit 23